MFRQRAQAQEHLGQLLQVRRPGQQVGAAAVHQVGDDQADDPRRQVLGVATQLAEVIEQRLQRDAAAVQLQPGLEQPRTGDLHALAVEQQQAQRLGLVDHPVVQFVAEDRLEFVEADAAGRLQVPLADDRLVRPSTWSRSRPCSQASSNSLMLALE